MCLSDELHYFVVLEVAMDILYLCYNFLACATKLLTSASVTPVLCAKKKLTYSPEHDKENERKVKGGRMGEGRKAKQRRLERRRKKRGDGKKGKGKKRGREKGWVSSTFYLLQIYLF